MAGRNQLRQAIGPGRVQAALRLDAQALIQRQVRRIEQPVGFDAVDGLVRVAPLDEPVAVVQAGEEEQAVGARLAQPGGHPAGILAMVGRAEQ